jgi:hypothetical protein
MVSKWAIPREWTQIKHFLDALPLLPDRRHLHAPAVDAAATSQQRLALRRIQMVWVLMRGGNAVRLGTDSATTIISSLASSFPDVCRLCT